MSEAQGERLKRIRLDKGLSLEEVHKKTKVHLNILKALEGESVSHLSPVYLKSFLKIYAKFLGIDYKELLPEAKEAKFPPQRFMGPKPLVQQKPRKPLVIKQDQTQPVSLNKASLRLGVIKATTLKFKKIIVLLFISTLFVFSLFALGKWIASWHSSQPKASEERVLKLAPKKEIKKKVLPAQMKPLAGLPAATKEPIAAKKPSSSGLDLVIRAKEKCWIEIKVDGKLQFRGELQKGMSNSWKAKEKMELSLGNAAAVELQFNNRIFSNLGKRNQQLKNILLDKNGLNIQR